MSEIPMENCPNCLTAMPVTAIKCGLCRIRLVRRTWKQKLLITTAAVLFVSIFLPAPFSIRYWLKLAVYRPNGKCGDGTYTFGHTCENHEAHFRWN